jgi:cytosol alanyl aminopeptidase
VQQADHPACPSAGTPERAMTLLQRSLLLLLVACATPPVSPASAVPPTPGLVVAAPEPPAGMRLPASFTPLAQRVELSVVPSAERFHGTTELDLELRIPTDTLWLNARGLDVQTASVRVGDSEVTAQISFSAERVGLRFSRPLGTGQATLRLAFAGVISVTEDAGIFRQKEGGDWYAMTQFEETEARRAFPCVDEPGAKIPWELTLRVPRELTAVSNTPIVSEEAAAEGMKRVRFRRTPPLPSYLVAFGVGRYGFVDARPAGAQRVPMRVYIPRGRMAEAAYAVRTSPEILETLEAYFGIPYPYEKLDLLAIPLTVQFGAMENAGLVTVASNRLLVTPKNQSLLFQRIWAVYAAHEFAHQWFGDLVTLAWWNDIWLNESFATWMENKAVDAWAPSWGMKVVEVTDRSKAAEQDTLVTARSIRQPIESYDDISNAFDGITYQKGAAVLRMFENYLGPAKFQRGVQQYLRRHANGNATAEDFLAAISEATGTDVAPAFSTFLDQPGVPQVSVRLVCPHGKAAELSLAQERLLPVGTTGKSDTRWQVPVCARWSSSDQEHQACTLMTGATATLALDGAGCPAWVLPNTGYAGYYRLNLEANLLQTLVTSGLPSLTTPETVGLLGDVHALVEAGRSSQGAGMELSTRFADAHERPVVAEAIELAQVREDFLEGPAATAYPAWVRGHFGARARALGMERRPGEDEETRLLRPALVSFVATRGEDPVLIAAARALTQRWLENPASVDPEMVDSALRIAGRFGNAELHSTLVTRLKASPDRAIRGKLLTALGAFQAPALVQANLALVEAAPIDARELNRLLFAGSTNPAMRTYSQSANPATWEMLFRAVREHFEAFASRLPEGAAAHLFLVARQFCDAKRRQEVETAFGPRAATVSGGKRALAQVLEGIDLCIARRAVQAPTIAAYLASAHSFSVPRAAASTPGSGG